MQSFANIGVQQRGRSWSYSTRLNQIKFCGLEKMRAVAAEFEKVYSHAGDCSVHTCSESQCVIIWNWDSKNRKQEKWHFTGVSDEHFAMAERFGQWMWSQRTGKNLRTEPLAHAMGPSYS